jgi:hypothetical protein
MNDDWRVRVICPTTATAVALSEELRSGSVEHELANSAGERVIVSVEQHELFLYASTRDQAEKAADAIKRLAATAGVSVSSELRRWHPIAEEWEDPQSPLPATTAEVSAEYAEETERERAESAAMHFSEFEVRVQCPSHSDVVALAATLRAEGIPSLRRWHYLLIGLPDEASADALAKRITPELPAGSTVETEATVRAVEAETPGNPFAIFGGMGG